MYKGRYQKLHLRGWTWERSTKHDMRPDPGSDLWSKLGEPGRRSLVRGGMIEIDGGMMQLSAQKISMSLISRRRR